MRRIAPLAVAFACALLAVWWSHRPGQTPVPTPSAHKATVERTPGAPPPRAPELRSLPIAGTCPATLEGAVRDAGGGTITGAAVSVLYDVNPDGSPAGENGAAATSNDAGHYALCSLASALALIEVRAEGYGTLRATTPLRGNAHRDFTLGLGATLTGRVVQADAKTPVADAEVEAIPSSPSALTRPTATVRTDVNGQFTISALPPGTFDLVARTDDAESDLIANVVAAIRSTPPLTLIVRQRSTVTGRVLATDGPVSGAVVHAQSLQFAARRSLPATTDRDGRFTLRRVSEGPNAFAVGTFAVIAPLQFRVPKTGAHDVEIRVTRLPDLRGRIEHDGKAVAGAVVSIADRVQRSDAAGRFLFDNLRAGSYRLQGRDDATGATGTVDITVGTAPKADVVVMLTDSARLRGVVRDQTGAAVGGVHVDVYSTDEKSFGSSITDGSGRFEIVGLSPVDHTVELRRENAPLHPVPPSAMVVRAGEDREHTFIVRRDNLTISGKVIDDQQQPVADARIVVGLGFSGPANAARLAGVPANAISRADGTFVVEELDAGSYGITANDADGDEGFTGNVAAGAHDVVVQMKRAGSISGRLIGFSSAPDVQAVRYEGGRYTPPTRATVAGDRYTLAGLSPGAWEVRTASAGDAASATATIAPGQKVTLDLQSGGKTQLTGTVVDFASGAPVPGLRCVVGLSDGVHRTTYWLPGEGWTDDNGKFVIDPAPSGRCSVTCWGPSEDISDGIALYGSGMSDATIPVVRAQSRPVPALGLEGDGSLIRFRFTEVATGKAGERAGLRAGDLVIGIDGRDARALSYSGVFASIFYRLPGEKVQLVVDRNGVSVPVTLPIEAGR